MSNPPARRPVASADPAAGQLRLPLPVWSVLCRRCGGPVSPPFAYAYSERSAHAIHGHCAQPGDTPPFDEARWRAATAIEGATRAPGDGPAAARGRG